MKTAIRKHVKDFVAIVMLALAALLVASFVLSHQRFYLPHWVPVIGSDFVDYKAEMSTAQAFTAGQGQTVLVAGVPVGEIGKVELKNGRARITMKLRRKFLPVYNDATLLARPKTGLNDMVLELDPGKPSAGKLPQDGSAVIPVQDTLPNVNPDEFFAGLDTDTRNYLQLLLAGAGQGLKGNDRNLSAFFKRFDPLSHDLAKLGNELQSRSDNISRSIHNFSVISKELGKRDTQLAGFVDASNKVFKAFANTDQGLRSTLRQLPGALDHTNTALASAGELTDRIGPALGKLRPTARGLAPALQSLQAFAKETTPAIRDQLRPFVKQAAPTVKVLRPASSNLKATLPDLATTFDVLNEVFNGLAYNPPGKDEGFLYWLAWVNHTSASMFGSEDANGPVRRGLVFNGCIGLLAFEKIGVKNPLLGALSDLLGAPNFQKTCPKEFAEQPKTTTPAPVAVAAKLTRSVAK